MSIQIISRKALHESRCERRQRRALVLRRRHHAMSETVRNSDLELHVLGVRTAS